MGTEVGVLVGDCAKAEDVENKRLKTRIFTAKWGARYPAIIRLWENAWSEFVPFLDYDVEIRRVICSTNAVESLNAYQSPRLPKPAEFVENA